MTGATSLRRVDARFVLPSPPRTAAVLGDLPGWVTGLAAAGVEVVPDAAAADLVVAPASLARWVRAPLALLVGPGGRLGVLRRDGYAVRRLLALPRQAQPQFVVDPACAAAAAYAGRRLPRIGAAARFALPLAPASAVPGSFAVAARAPGPPYLLAAAAALGAEPGSGWYLALGAGGVRKRAAFVLFPRGAAAPAQVLKFARLPSSAGAFDRDEAGLRLAVRAGASVSARAPRLVGRGFLHGLPASVETAVPGVPLTRLLPGRRGLAVAERVAAWTVDVARTTAAPPAALAGERARLAAAAPGLVAALPPVPGVFRHDDLWPDNVLVDGDDFGLVDWEHARACGLPLADLLFFAAHALGGDDPVALFTGRSAESPRLFRWVGRLAAALDLPATAVGPLAALAWHEYGARARTSRLAREAATGSPVPPYLPERLAAAWLTTPGLGAGWPAFRP